MELNQPADIFNANAALYQERFMDVSAYACGLHAFCDKLPQAAMVLDVGCGPGNIGVFLKQYRPDIDIHGIDAAPNMITLARQNIARGSFEVMDARDIGSLEPRFNGVVIGFCLPYLSLADTMQLIADAVGLLVPGGVLYLSAMEEDETNRSGVRTSKSGSIHMYYHKAAELVDALTKAGCTVDRLERQPYADANGAATDLVILASKPIAD